MKIVFKKAELSLIETDRFRETRLPDSVVIACRRKLNYIRAASDERDLRSWKSLHYEKLSGTREGQRSVRINLQWRLVFTLELEDGGLQMTVLGVEDYH